MKTYYCECCDYVAKQKSHYEKHLTSNRHAQNFVTFTQNIVHNKDKTIQCLHCDKMFTTKRSMQRHVKTSCKVVKEQEKKALEVKIQKIEENNQILLKKMEKMSNNPQINHINNGVINNIVLNHYDETDVSFLTDSDYRHCLTQRNKCIPTMVEKIHCNPQHPENMNIIIKNFKNELLNVFKGNKWISCDRDHELHRLVIRTTEKLEDWIHSLPEDSEYDKIRTLGEIVIAGTENTETLESIFKEVILILYNNRNLMSEVSVVDEQDVLCA